VTNLARNSLSGDDQSDHWLMQTILEHSSSDSARTAAAAWLDTFDAALALGAAAPHAHMVADAAYRATATMAGLPTGDWR
jgi:hypothetical protein